MAPALTAEAWVRALALYRASNDRNISLMATMLTDVIESSDDLMVARIFDSYASEMLEGT
jgi:hypothetical protein